ncbi:MAG: helix-turn-helix domain-containing protein [Bacteroidales bacterium]|nr:helix-turn-helix domain-containing protein [Bacteroidales bacterium]
MYSLKEAWMLTFGKAPFKDWDGEIFCYKTNAADTLRTNETHGYVLAYTFTIVTKGTVTIQNNLKTLTLHPNDLYIYSPGQPVKIINTSDDYCGICLLADEEATFRIPYVRDLISIVYTPIVQLQTQKITLTYNTARRIVAKMHEIIGLMQSKHAYKKEILQMLLSIFLLEIQNIKEQKSVTKKLPKRTEELFIDFMQLLPRHFAAHHNIDFYAERLNITPDYLSRIVKRASGRTVLDYINRLIMMEASFMLRTSSQSAAQIAEALHFADLASFSHFFIRHKGVSPQKFRTL